jgi:hypothetical protein
MLHTVDGASVNNLRLRPVYDWVSADTPEEFIARLNQLVSFDPAINIACVERHALLTIAKEALHTWSPTLDIEARPHGSQTHVHARLAPEPSVWTFFVFCYAATVFLGLMTSMLGVAQYASQMTPWGFAGLPAALLVMGGLYLASAVGKRLGADQIHRLLAVCETNLSVDATEFDPTQA